MTLARTSILIRGAAATLLGVVAALAAITAALSGSDMPGVAPLIAAILALSAAAFAATAASALILHTATRNNTIDTARLERARLAYRVATYGLVVTAVAGLAGGALAALINSAPEALGVAAYTTAIMLLIQLLVLRRHGRQIARAANDLSAVRDTEPSRSADPQPR